MSELANGALPVAVVGMGLMGRSIAACLLAAGHPVTGITDDQEACAAIAQRIGDLLEEMAQEGLLAQPTALVMQRLRVAEGLAAAAHCRMVFESVTEDLTVKRQVLRGVEEVVAKDCLLASNTSALPITLLQQGALHPERILGIHWDEPAHVTRFMEIIPGDETAAEYMDEVARLAPSWGKDPSRLRRELRGFVANRISYAMYREACHLVDSGVCSVEDVDRSLRNDVGWWSPFAGPFRYMDLMGVEGYYRVMEDLLPELSRETGIPKLIRDVVETGGRGIQNGRGFYTYTPEEAKAWEERFIAFNYEIRRLTRKYAGPAAGAEGKDEA